MHVIATAGHVDHGKSTLVRALTGTEPDRWAEERRRGMTIDLGYAWTSLPGRPADELLAFVDVPGHQRFIGNMLAGLGPAPAVLVVVAADEGWREQSAEHLAAVDALGVRYGLIAVTRSDLADPSTALTQARRHAATSSLGEVEAVAVSGLTGKGLPELRAALGRLVERLPEPVTTGRVRLWVDRSFTVRGSGTVVTGTLGTGQLAVGDELEVHGRRVRVRGLQCAGRPADVVPAVARVAVNLRGVPQDAVRRGDALLTPGAWHLTSSVDVRLGVDAARLPAQLLLHLGTAELPARVRALGGRIARLSVPRPLPLQVADRAILRDPGAQLLAASVLIVDPDPPALTRRGAARRRADDLATTEPDARAEVRRRGAVRCSHLIRLGVPVADDLPVRRAGDWLIAPDIWTDWAGYLTTLVDERARAAPLDPGLRAETAVQQLDLPDRALLAPLVAHADLQLVDGQVRRPGTTASLGKSEPAMRALEQRLAAAPFAAPERADLGQLGLGTAELAVAIASGRLIRIAPDVVLLPAALDQARRLLQRLPQPFTTSEARQALGTTRRIAVPLLERLDAEGVTRRLDANGRRETVRRASPA
jgi:selenocysteine-specific elongation factor